MDEFEKKKAELLQPLFFEAGAALMDCQTLEYGVAMLLYHLAMHGAPGLDLWLANYYFADDSSGFAVLLRFCDARSKDWQSLPRQSSSASRGTKFVSRKNPVLDQPKFGRVN